MFPAIHGIAAASGGGAYAADGINFDGTNDYLTRGADLTGNADSKLITGSLWFKRDATGNQKFYTASGSLHRIHILSGHTFEVRLEGVSSGEIVTMDGLTGMSDTTAWHHFCFCVDTADINKMKFFFDDADDLDNGSKAVTDENIDFTLSSHAIGATTSGGSKWNGCLADVWLAFGQYLDISVTANRRKFIDASGNPVNLGSDGSTPTGTAPIMFFQGATASWHTNKGSGGGFTENGALTDCATDP